MPARELLRHAYLSWAASEAWTLIPPAASGVAGGVRPGVQWMSMWDGAMEVLIHPGHTYLRGTIQLAMLGYALDERVRRDVIGDRWVRCGTSGWLRKAEDHSAIGMLGKPVRHALEDAPAVTVVERGRHLELAAERVRVLVEEGEPPRIAGFREPDEELTVLHHGDMSPLGVPDLTGAEILELHEAAAALAAARRPSRRRAGRSVRVDVERVGESWHVCSPDLTEALGLESAVEAEAAVLEGLARDAPHLLGLVELDSYDDVVSAYADDEVAAREFAAVLRQVPGA